MGSREFFFPPSVPPSGSFKGSYYSMLNLKCSSRKRDLSMHKAEKGQSLVYVLLYWTFSGRCTGENGFSHCTTPC